MINQENNLNIENEEIQEKIENDLADIYNYPSIGKLFSTDDSKDLQQLRNKLNTTVEKLDLIIRRGSNAEADKASKALEAVKITLNFLQKLEDERNVDSK